MNTIDAIEFLKAKSCIKGINIDDLKSLLTDATVGKRYKDYTIKMINQNSILINDTSKGNKNTLFRCVKDFDICNNKSNNCTQIRAELGVPPNATLACNECYISYINKIKSGEL